MTVETAPELGPYVAGMTWGWTGVRGTWATAEASASSLPGEVSPGEQLRYYRVMFEACAPRAWVGGFMLWDWPARLYSAHEATANDDYCPYGKPAGEYLRAQYTVLSSGVAR